MNWDTFYKQFQAKQPQITWDEYYKTLPIKAPVYTTEMLYNTQAKPKTKFTETDFQPLNIEWKFDWSQYGSYDETDPTEQLRKIRNVPPYSIVSTYDFSDSEDKKRFEEGLPSKALESRILSTQARKEARAYLQERQRLFEDLLKQKQSEKILGIIPKPWVQKIEPEEYEPEEIPATIAAWRGYQQALEEYQKRLDAMTPEEYEYRKLIGALPKPPEPPLFEPPEEFKELDKDLWEEYIRKQEEERRKARQATSIPVTKRTEPPTSSTPTTPSPQSSGIEALKQIAEKYPVTLSGPVYRGELERAQQQIPQRPVQQAPSASEIKKPTSVATPTSKTMGTSEPQTKKESTPFVLSLLTQEWDRFKQQLYEGFIKPLQEGKGIKLPGQAAQEALEKSPDSPHKAIAKTALDMGETIAKFINRIGEIAASITSGGNTVADLTNNYSTTEIKALDTTADIVGQFLGLSVPIPGMGVSQMDVYSRAGETAQKVGSKIIDRLPGQVLTAKVLKGSTDILSNPKLRNAVESAAGYAGTFGTMGFMNSLMQDKPVQETAKDTAVSVLTAAVIGAARPQVQELIYKGLNKAARPILEKYLKNVVGLNDEAIKALTAKYNLSEVFKQYGGAELRKLGVNQEAIKATLTKEAIADIITSFGGSASVFFLYEFAQQPFMPKEERKAIEDIAKDAAAMGLYSLMRDLTSGRIGLDKFRQEYAMYSRAVEPIVLTQAEAEAAVALAKSNEMDTMRNVMRNLNMKGRQIPSALVQRYQVEREKLEAATRSQYVSDTDKTYVRNLISEMDNYISGTPIPQPAPQSATQESVQETRLLGVPQQVTEAQQPGTTTIETRAPEQIITPQPTTQLAVQSVTQQPAQEQPVIQPVQQPVEQATIQQPTQETVQQPSKYAQYIGQQVKLKPPYGNVTVKGETDTHVIVDKQGEEKRILKNAFSRLIEQEPAPLPEQVQDEIPADSVRVLPVNAINVDPARFQFKADVESKTGASRTLDIKKWDPYLAGVVLVWQDNNGRYWVVNGHHRLQKAKELGVDTINVHVIREADGYSDKDARELGAKINIAEGHGTLTDAAKLFRDGGYTLEQIQEEGLPLRSGNALKGLHLAQLNDNLFDKVITKQLTEEKGAIIGEILPTDKGGINDAKQNYIWDKIKDARVSADEVREMAEMLKDTDAKPRTEQTLLGEWLVWDIADFDIKPKLIADTKSVLISNKNAFNKVLKNSKALQEAGNVLVEGENIRRRDLLSQAVAIVDRGKNLKGHPINDILNIYTEQIKAGMSKSTAAEKAANEIVELIASGKYFEQMKKELQAAKVKTGEQIDMLGGFKSEVEERDSQQGERVSQDTGEIQAADTEAAATAEARTPSPKEPWQMTKDEFIQNVLDKKYDFPRLGTKGEMMSKYVDAYKNTLKRDPETAEIALSRIKEAATNEHKANILEAIVEGKPVPEEILKDYPDIQQGAQVSGTEPETQDIKPKQTVEPKKSSISANEYTENLYQAIVSNGQNLLTEGGIFYGKEGALRLAREYGYGLANYPEKEASDTIQSSYGRLCVRLYALQPPISAKEWVKEIEKGIKQAKSKLQEKKMSTQEGHRESVIDETKILTPEQLIELNQQMIEKGQPITRDSVGYNKLDFYFAYSLSKETQLSNKQLASLANILAKYGKTQLNIDPQILKNTAEHYRKLSEAGTIPISIQHQPSGGNEWIAEIAGRDEKYKYKRKFLKPAKREWSSTGKTGITIFRLEEGKIYEINEPYKGRRFVKVENGEIKPIEQGEVAQSSVKVQSFQRRITQGSVLTSRVMEQQIAKGEIGEPVKRSEIEQFVREKFDIPIGYGKFRQRVAGIYKVHPEVIRLKKPKDIEVLFHEVGHFLDDKLKLTSSQFAGELLELGKPSSRESYTKIQVMEEGVAEFVRLYTIVPEEAKAKAPQFYQYFKTRLAQNKEFEDVLKTLQVATENYIKQDPVERVLSNIDFGEKTIGKKLDTSRLYTLMFDELHGLKKATDMIVGNEKIATSANPFELAWLHRGWQGKAEVFLEHGVLDENFKKVYKSFDEIIKPVKNNLREFSAYATAKRAQELHDRGIETGLLDSDIKATLERFKNKGYDKVLNELVEYQNNVLYETLVKSGILSQEAYTAMTEINKHYVPFYRVMENVGTGTGKGFQTYQPIRRIKGSQRDIVDPLSSIIKNVYLFTNIASRNNVGKALADLAEQYKGSGKVIDKVPPRVIPHKVVLSQIEKVLTDVGVDVDTIDLDAVATFFTPTGYSKKDKVITIYKNGKPEYYEVFADDVYRAFLALDQEQTNTVIKLLSYPAKALRVGATTLSPEFALGRNPVRDTILAAITSKNNFIPVFDTVRGLYHVLGKTDEYYKLKAAGAMNSTLLSLDRNSLRRKLEEFADKGPKEQLKTVVTTPLRLLIAMTDAFEESTRVGAGLKALKKQGAEREGYLKAALEARDITVDFLRFGTATKQANKIIAFFNVAFQGAEKVYRSFREDPLGSTIRSFMYITLPSIALWFINRDDERYKELPGWQRDLFWIIPGGKHMWRIPKPPLLGQLFGSFVERALTAVYDEDKKAFEGFFDNFVSDLLPNVIPTALLPVIEIVSNYDFFREYPVVPANEQQLEPPQQYGHYTSEFAKWIGETFYVSPRKVDHLIQGYTGRLGTFITDLIDLFGEVTGIKESKAPAKTTAETLPVVRGFVADTHRSYSVDQFYKKYKELERKYATARVKDKAMNLNRFEEGGKLRAMRKTVDRLAKLRQRIEEIYNDPHLSPERKQEEIEALQKEMTELAKEALK